MGDKRLGKGGVGWQEAAECVWVTGCVWVMGTAQGCDEGVVGSKGARHGGAGWREASAGVWAPRTVQGCGVGGVWLTRRGERTGWRRRRGVCG
ncbi:hypothetical protein K439DRAFT_1075621 [Ramaria rubella]|nr:hypothetical protein K439DRAFT_1075621 [Ramaria rubella]